MGSGRPGTGSEYQGSRSTLECQSESQFDYQRHIGTQFRSFPLHRCKATERAHTRIRRLEHPHWPEEVRIVAEDVTHYKRATHGCHVPHCCITGISFAQVGRLCGSPGARTGGSKPRPYGGYGDSHSVHQCGWNAGERVRHATCEVLCRGGVYPRPPRPSGTHHLSEGDTRDVRMYEPGTIYCLVTNDFLGG